MGPVSAGAHVLVLVAVVAAVVLEVAEPPLGHAALVPALELSLVRAHGAVLRQLVSAVPAVVLAIAEEPLGDAAVVVVAGTPPPALRAVPLAAEVGGLVTVVTAVVIEVAVPQFGDTLAIIAGKLSLLVTLTVVAHSIILVGSVQTVRVSVTL